MKILKEYSRIPWNKGLKTNKPSINSKNLSKDELYNLYINQMMTSEEIAKIYNCSSKTVRNWLNKYEIPVRSISDSVKLERSKWPPEKELNRSRKFHQTWVDKPQAEKDELIKKRMSSPNINSPEAILKSYNTKIRKGTSNQSKSENEFLHKLEILGIDKDNIIHHYIDTNRYPYNCDFYIKSKDLFIEYQGHWTHGPDIFNKNDENQLNYLIKMQDKGINMDTWINRDPKKLNTALKNKINLILVYPKGNTYFINNGKITTIDINDINKI